MAENLPKGGRILDLGCGQGNDVLLFTKFGFKTVGIDGSVGMIKEGKKRFPKANLLVMDTRVLKFPNDSFDAVWSWSVLTHLNKDDKAIAMSEINRVLKVGGLFTQMVWRGRGVFINQYIYPRTHFLLSTPSWKKLYLETGFKEPIVKHVKGLKRDFIRLTALKPK